MYICMSTVTCFVPRTNPSDVIRGILGMIQVGQEYIGFMPFEYIKHIHIKSRFAVRSISQ